MSNFIKHCFETISFLSYDTLVMVVVGLLAFYCSNQATYVCQRDGIYGAGIQQDFYPF